MKLIFLTEIKAAEDSGAQITEGLFAKKYGYTPRQIANIVRDLIDEGYLIKIKQGWFIDEYQLTEDGKRALYAD